MGVVGTDSVQTNHSGLEKRQSYPFFHKEGKKRRLCSKRCSKNKINKGVVVGGMEGGGHIHFFTRDGGWGRNRFRSK